MSYYWNKIPKYGKLYLTGAVIVSPLNTGFNYYNDKIRTEHLQKLNASSRVTCEILNERTTYEKINEVVFWPSAPFIWYLYYSDNKQLLKMTKETVKILDIKLNLIESVNAMPQDEIHLGGALKMLQQGHDKL